MSRIIYIRFTQSQKVGKVGKPNNFKVFVSNKTIGKQDNSKMVRLNNGKYSENIFHIRRRKKPLPIFFGDSFHLICQKNVKNETK